MITSMLRLYLVVALAAILSVFSIDRGSDFFFANEIAVADEAEYATALYMLRNFLGSTQASQQAGLATLERFSPGQYVAQAPAQVAALPDDERHKLLTSGFFHSRHADDFGYDRYIRLDNGTVIAVRARGLNLYWLKVTAFFIVFMMLLAAVLFWSVPHWRDLGKLGQAAARFGSGDLGARAKLSRYTTVKALSEHFNNMAGRMEQLIRTQRDMANAASHELRTPLSRLEFGLAILRDTIGETTPDSPALARIDALGGDIEELNALVGELLTFGMLEAGVARLESLDVAPFLMAASPPADGARFRTCCKTPCATRPAASSCASNRASPASGAWWWKTTAPAFRPRNAVASSNLFTGSTAVATAPPAASAWAWRSCIASSNATAARYGPKPRRWAARALSSSWPSPEAAFSTIVACFHGGCAGAQRVVNLSIILAS
jgi:signal transduction histidine kinase